MVCTGRWISILLFLGMTNFILIFISWWKNQRLQKLWFLNKCFPRSLSFLRINMCATTMIFFFLKTSDFKYKRKNIMMNFQRKIDPAYKWIRASQFKWQTLLVMLCYYRSCHRFPNFSIMNILLRSNTSTPLLPS